jgi:hypothetical protein
MEDLLIALTESASVLGINRQSGVFLSALDLGKEALASGMSTEDAVEFARRVLRDAATSAVVVTAA